MSRQELQASESFTIPPGQFGYLLISKEAVAVPPNAMAFIRLLKNSFAFGDEAGVIAVVDEDVPDEPPGGA